MFKLKNISKLTFKKLALLYPLDVSEPLLPALGGLVRHASPHRVASLASLLLSAPSPWLSAILTSFCMFTGPYELPAHINNFLRFLVIFKRLSGDACT